jgi:hypothetical protein
VKSIYSEIKEHMTKTEKDTQHSKLLSTGKIPNHLCEATFYLKESRGIMEGNNFIWTT